MGWGEAHQFGYLKKYQNLEKRHLIMGGTKDASFLTMVFWVCRKTIKANAIRKCKSVSINIRIERCLSWVVWTVYIVNQLGCLQNVQVFQGDVRQVYLITAVILKT